MSKHTLKKNGHSCPMVAAYIVGHDYGVDKFAKETYQSAGAVYNKLNPDNDSNHLYLRDAIHLTEKANNDLILETWATNRGYMLVKIPEQVSCDEELCDQLMKMSESHGNTLGEIRQARADGIITPEEFTAITQKIKSQITEVLALKELIRGQVREMPRHITSVIEK